MKKKIQHIYIYRLQFTDSAKFMTSSLSSLVHYHSFLKEFIKLTVNTDTMVKNRKLEELNINISTAFLEYTNF